MRRSSAALALAPVAFSLGVLGFSFASPSVALAQTPAAPAEDAEPPRSRRVREAEEEPWSEEQVEARRRRRSLVQRDEPSEEDDGSYYDGGRDQEPYDPQERERARHTGGGGVSARSVGLALTISGLVVGLTGAAVGIAGTAAEDKTTTIVGAFIGLGGGALSVTGLIINLTASSGAQASTDPALGVAIGPGSASLFGSF